MAYSNNSDWQSDKSLQQCLLHMLENEICDVTFKITYKSSQSSEPVYIKALRTLLFARSSVFFAMFCGEMKEETGAVITVTDVDPDAFRQLIRYIYTDDAHITADNVLSVIYAATKYIVSGLTKLCMEFLEDNMDPDNAPVILDNSIKFSNEELVDKSLDMIQSNAINALSSSSVSNISREAFTRIVKYNCLNVDEIHVFKACISWAKAQCQSKQVAETGENMRAMLADIIYDIRFPTMSMEEFNEEVIPCDILTQSEGFDLYRYIASTTKPTDVAFPMHSRMLQKLYFEKIVYKPERIPPEYIYSCHSSNNIVLSTISLGYKQSIKMHVVISQDNDKLIDKSYDTASVSVGNNMLDHQRIHLNNVFIQAGTFELKLKHLVPKKVKLAHLTRDQILKNDMISLKLQDSSQGNILYGIEFFSQ